MHALRRAMRYLGPYWLTALGAVVSLLLVTAANLVIPQLIRRPACPDPAMRKISLVSPSGSRK